jgi:hypothetical protein
MAKGKGEEEDGAVAKEPAPAMGEPDPGCISTGYPGDDRCPAPIDPSEGFQIHFGPSDYDDPDEVAKYVLEPGSEALKCQYVTTPNDEEIFYVDWLNTLRPSSHHMIITMTDPNVPDGFGDCNQGSITFSAGLVGGNSTEVSAFEEMAPENEGIARTIPPHSKIEMQLHFFNPTDKPLLMEAWQNIYYFDPAEVRGIAGTIFGIAGLRMNIQPGEQDVVSGRMVAPTDMRILSLTGHNHNHTLRFSAYVERGDEKTLVYESYDWAHPAYLAYDSVHENPSPDPTRLIPGGYSGVLELARGDAIRWECEIVNDDLDIPLTYANRALDAEMCNLHGINTPRINDGGWNAFLP